MSSMGSNMQPQQNCNFQETVQITQKDQSQTYSNSHGAQLCLTTGYDKSSC